MDNSGLTPVSLQKELRSINFFGWACLCVLALTVSGLWKWVAALQWAMSAGLLWLVVIHVTTRRLDMNRPAADAPIADSLGPANRLTILRGGLIAATGGFLFLDPPPGILIWVPGLFYCTAAILDRLDGYVARKTGRTSLLGVELDTVFDALGLAVAPLLAVWYGKLHWSYLLFSSAWYLFRWGIHRRERAGLRVQALVPNPVRRAWAGFQMGFIGVVLLPVFESGFTRVAGVAFVIPVLAGFLIDWLVVSGAIDRDDTETSRRPQIVNRLVESLMLPGLRLLVAALVVMMLVTTQGPITLAMSLLAIPVLAGLAGRAAALAILVHVGFYYQAHPYDLHAQILTCALVWVMLLGTGRYSLWAPDERWINRYDGA